MGYENQGTVAGMRDRTFEGQLLPSDLFVKGLTGRQVTAIGSLTRLLHYACRTWLGPLLPEQDHTTRRSASRGINFMASSLEPLERQPVATARR